MLTYRVTLFHILTAKQEVDDFNPEKPVFNLAAVVAETLGLDAHIEESVSP